ncbi:hypothetical protein [Prevotella sp. KH2C16]|uniref:hypothetical protein n=1 Tax=Prevotella sp. KH2C16 TaxID=1855325 RepID=UPI0008E602AB|nr:hypothetical protein [Prevotella sp. KH2C16]SFG79043.1 hypothetical protein SAMN05216383_1562 [Prevotella sp. KH2C16]
MRYITYFILLTLVCFSSCNKQGISSADKLLVIGNDTLSLFCAYSWDDGYMAYYKDSDKLVGIDNEFIKDISQEINDTVIYWITKDSIYRSDGNLVYYVKDGLIVREYQYFGFKSPYEREYIYDSNRCLTHTMRLDSKDYFSNYIWNQDRLERIETTEPYFFILDGTAYIKYGRWKESTVNGGLPFYMFRLLDGKEKDPFPLILMGYYGKVPRQDISSFVFQDIRKNSLIKETYESEYNSEGQLESIKIENNDKTNKTFHFEFGPADLQD